MQPDGYCLISDCCRKLDGDQHCGHNTHQEYSHILQYCHLLTIIVPWKPNRFIFNPKCLQNMSLSSPIGGNIWGVFCDFRMKTVLCNHCSQCNDKVIWVFKINPLAVGVFCMWNCIWEEWWEVTVELCNQNQIVWIATGEEKLLCRLTYVVMVVSDMQAPNIRVKPSAITMTHLENGGRLSQYKDAYQYQSYQYRINIIKMTILPV